MDFNRHWTTFALCAEHDDFGMLRIAKAHNAVFEEREKLRADLAAARAQIEDIKRGNLLIAGALCDSQKELSESRAEIERLNGRRWTLREFCEYLESHGYIDSDWRTEEPGPIEEFTKQFEAKDEKASG